MRIRIHHALFVGFVGIVGLLVLLLIPLVGRGLSRELRITFRADVEREVALAAMTLANADGADPDSIARSITERIGYRVTLIDTAGVVLGDSYVERGRLAAVENHLSRPEVQGALGAPREVSFSDRVSSTVGLSMLYGAQLTEFEGEPVIVRIAAPETDIVRVVDRVQRTVVLTGLFALVVSVFAAYFLSRAFARPLVVLADRARRLTEGDFSGRVPHTRVVELEDLSVAFNRLTDELQSRLSELSLERDEMETLIDCMAEGVVALTEDARVMRTNRASRVLLDLPDAIPLAPIGTVVRDQELRAALEASVSTEVQSRELVLGGRHLRLTSRALDQGGSVTTFLDVSEMRRLEEVRRDFVANASHELKTPLTVIRGYAETLLEGDPPEALRRQFLESIEKNALRLHRLVEDLLDLSRLESGGWSAASEVVLVEGAAREAWDLVGDGERGAERRFTIEGSAEIRGDHQGLVHVFRNLMENSVRHTEAGGQVRVRISADDERVTVVVADDGEGIPMRALDRIFERFYRADSSRARDFGGTGLGLAIVRHLVGAMGGDVSAESELGKGTTMRMTIPRG
jgi:two-component system, OmpR family, phosphate regulon sensor histidine kinase PhoR